MIKKVAIFDVDKTIINGDSMFMLLFYTIKKKPKAIIGLPRLFIMLVLYALNIIDTKKAKEEMFYVINYLNEKDLEDFFKEKILKHTFFDAKEEIIKRKKEGYTVILVSASPECYIKYFKKYFDVDFVLGTILRKTQEGYTNIIDGENCKGEEKVLRLKKLLEIENINIDRENSLCFSDSLSDMPLFNLVENRFLINNNKKLNGFKNLRWK
ncbi:HAD-IB family hydrolase [Thermobrachium celere]|uniref:Phosphoserine phosphatase n=1 Tax=Thermobrachium celere DSM 8682 TaxID=941824 RepID=R7RSR9_9CLOT|nr:HAD-IB family hydrolase [Thermobrachium celere]CDF59247.1 Phosphoserine phosphatase [Thermobrachium celere DSM 8682]